MTLERRQEEEPHFFPRVLFWERESIFLAASEILKETRGLEFPVEAVTDEGVLRTRCPTGVLKDAWLRRPGALNLTQSRLTGLVFSVISPNDTRNGPESSIACQASAGSSRRWLRFEVEIVAVSISSSPHWRRHLSPSDGGSPGAGPSSHLGG